MSDKKKNEEIEKNPGVTETKALHYSDHNPKTRRQFMAQGLLGFSALAFAPELLLKAAHGQTATACAVSGGGGLTPVIIIDIAGGGNIAGGNVMVGGAGGQMDFLQSYSTNGLNVSEHPSLANQINQDMGLVFHSGSGVLAGIKSIASITTQQQMEGTIFATISNDDTGNNQSNPIYWLNKAGAKGALTQLGGTQESPSGGNSQSPIESINPTNAPVRVRNRNDALNLVSLGNSLTGTYNQNQLDAILSRSSAVSQKKLDSIPKKSLPDAIKKIVTCGFSGTPQQVKNFSPTVVDPDGDTVITPIFNKITNTGVRDVAKPLVKLVLDGVLGAGTITLGGYDYHDNTRTSGDARDRELGQLIGAIVETAALRQKDVVIYVLTDGGVGSNINNVDGNNRLVWLGDNGERSSSFMMVYKKDGRPAMRNNKRQIGYFQANGAVAPTAALTSNSVTNTAKAMVANYLALHGLEGRLEQVVSDDPFRLQLDSYLSFDKLR